MPDLHLYEVLGAYLTHGATSSATRRWASSRRSARRSRTSRPATGSSSRSTSPAATAGCASAGLYAQCETTQVREPGQGRRLFGYTSLYGSVPGGQAEYLRVPQAQFGPIKVPEGPPDERFVYLSDVLPTAWQAVAYADVPRPAARSPSSASARSARWPRGSPAPRRRPGHRGRPRPRAARAGAARGRDARPQRRRRTSPEP